MGQDYDGSSSGPAQGGSSDKKKTLKRVFVRFAERTSLQGIPHIYGSKVWYAKLIWAVLFLIAIGFMIIHLYTLINSYIAFDKHIRMTLGFSNLTFPTVTVCNVNPVRASQIALANPELKGFLEGISPEAIMKSMKEAQQVPQGFNPLHGGNQDQIFPDGGNLDQNFPLGDNQDRNPEEFSDQAFRRKKRFLDEMDYAFKSSNRTAVDSQNKRIQPSGEKSNIHELREEFNYLFSSHNRSTRISMGHNLTDMLVSCSFAGVKCDASQFRVHPTTTYGNCYTLENPDFVSYRSGPRNGLEIILFLETDEYIPTIASGNGAHIEIHDTNTWPDPEANGMAISAGMDTNIAMRMTQIERLHRPYGWCENGDAFLAKYGRKYTRKTCQAVCMKEITDSKCKCYNREDYELQNAMFDEKNMSECREVEDVQCMVDVQADMEMGSLNCKCHNPCKETAYQKTVTNRAWPSDEYADILVQYLCDNRNQTECEIFEKMDIFKFSQNFIKVNIYFEDLNYEHIIEAPDYEDVQFFSDVGGTIGLWIGLSILSVAELGQFVVELVHFLCCVRPRLQKNDYSKGIDNLEY